MLLIYNVDRPGVIGTVGRVLGDHDINIARMQCSRAERGGNALLIIGLDAPLPAQVLETIKREKDILSVRLVDLSKAL
ncbi:MAG: ACT domain-containing protein [Nitrospirae bacterium]|nr:ACT domain-containing protein [Nitrospirota bacterium]